MRHPILLSCAVAAISLCIIGFIVVANYGYHQHALSNQDARGATSVTSSSPDFLTNSSSVASTSSLSYTDPAFGISFQYPSAWGDVVSSTGNTGEELTYCQDGPLSTVGDFNTVLLYDGELTFTQDGYGTTINILRNIAAHPFLPYCEQEGSGVNLAQDQNQLRSTGVPLDLAEGNTAYERPLNFVDISPTLNGAQDIAIEADFIIYHGTDRFEISDMFDQYYSLENFGCVASSTGSINQQCALEWLKINSYAQGFSTYLQSLTGLVRSITFEASTSSPMSSVP